MYVMQDPIGGETELGNQRRRESHEKWIVVTTVQKPTKAVRQLLNVDGWKIVVVGDRKTPDNWM